MAQKYGISGNPDLVATVLKGEKSRKGSVTFDAQEFASRRRSDWIDSSKVKNCHKCSAAFTLTNRKHHCRECGQVFCTHCSNCKLVINGILKRACVDCYTTVMNGGTATIPLPRVSISKDTEFNDKEKLEIASRQSFSGSENDADDSSGWVDAVLLVASGENGPAVDSMFPSQLPPCLVEDIVSMSIPQSHMSQQKEETVDYNFCFTVRTTKAGNRGTAVPGNDSADSERALAELLYCFVSYRQSVALRASRSELQQQSLVLVSRMPIPSLAYSILSTLETTLYHVRHKEGVDDSVKEGIQKTFEVTLEQINSWPILDLILQEGGGLRTPIFQFTVAIPRPVATKNSLDFSSLSLGPAVSFSSGTNIISQFGPYGLIPHLWTLWELLVGGRDVLVLASTPDACSQMVIALSSLVLTPLNGYAGDNLRPFISKHDSDVSLIADAVKKKRKQEASVGDNIRSAERGSYIVGITDPTLLLDFRHFSALIVLSPMRQGRSAYEMSPGVVMKAEKRASFSGKIAGANKNLTMEDMEEESLLRYNSKFSAVVRFPTEEEQQATVYSSSRDEFAAAENVVNVEAGVRSSETEGTSEGPSKGSKKKKKEHRTPSFFSRSFVVWKKLSDKGVYTPGLLVLPSEPAPSPLQTEICKRLKKLNAKDYLILGHRVLRDHFDELTTAFYKPLVEDVKSQSEGMKSPTTEPRIEVATTSGDKSLNSTGSPLVKEDATTGSVLVEIVKQGTGVIISAVGSNLQATLAALPDQNTWNTWKRALGVEVSESNTDSSQRRFLSSSQSLRVAGSEVKGSVNFSGVWKRGKVVNFDDYAAAQGLPYVMRKITGSVQMVHTITMDKELTVCRVQEKGGPITTDIAMVIGGDAVEMVRNGKNYLCSATWHSPDVLQITELALPGKEYELIILCTLQNNGEVLHEDATYHSFSPEKRVKCSMIFDKVGPSPNPLPATVRRVSTEAANEENAETAASATPSTVSGKTDLSGVWERTRTHNVDSYVGAQGAGFVQRKLATSMAMTHTITMNPPDLNAFRLQEVGGPLNSDMLYTLDTPPMPTNIMKRKFNDTATWITDSNPPTLQVTRVHEDNDFTLIHKRFIEDTGGEPTLVMVATYKDHATGQETTGTSWFKRTGPSPNSPPEPSVKIDNDTQGKIESTGSDVGGNVDKSCEDKNQRSSSGMLEWERTPQSSRDVNQSGDAGDVGSLKKRSLSSSLRVDISGVWTRQDGMGSSGAASSGGFSSVAVSHVITMDPPFYSGVRIQENNGPLSADYSYRIGADYISTVVNKRKFIERCYWEGEALVQKRIPESRDYELIMKRYLEDAPSVGGTTVARKDSRLRLVTVKKNLKTGDETETIQFFKRTGPSPHALGEVFAVERASQVDQVQDKKPISNRVSFGPSETIPDRSSSPNAV